MAEVNFIRGQVLGNRRLFKPPFNDIERWDDLERITVSLEAKHDFLDNPSRTFLGILAWEVYMSQEQNCIALRSPQCITETSTRHRVQVEQMLPWEDSAAQCLT